MAFLAFSTLSDAEVPGASGLELDLDATGADEVLEFDDVLAAFCDAFFLTLVLRVSESVERPPLFAALPWEAEEFSESEELESVPEDEDELEELEELLLPDVDSELVVGFFLGVIIKSLE